MMVAALTVWVYASRTLIMVGSYGRLIWWLWVHWDGGWSCLLGCASDHLERRCGVGRDEVLLASGWDTWPESRTTESKPQVLGYR